MVDLNRRESAFGSVSRLPMPSGLMARQIHLQQPGTSTGTAPASEWTRYIGLAHKNCGPVLSDQELEILIVTP